LALQVIELKTKVQEQDKVLSVLLREKKAADSDVSININNQSPVAVNGLPSSCADLKSMGHIWNGFYSVMGNTTMESVYCDFTKPPSDAGNFDYSAYCMFSCNHQYFLNIFYYDLLYLEKVSKNGSDTTASNQHPSISTLRDLIVSTQKDSQLTTLTYR
jgi:hypothetical protein